jgi:DNA repair exonuclease SbcCD ATPase subunit
LLSEQKLQQEQLMKVIQGLE